MLRPLLVLCLLAAPAAAKSTDDWLGGLTDRVIADLAAGKPLVVEVHVPLCESSIIACGNAKLGDGDTPETNLYWSTTPGFGGARAGRRRSERRRQDRSRRVEPQDAARVHGRRARRVRRAELEAAYFRDAYLVLRAACASFTSAQP